ncbi:MAG TPA: hypothetical protein VFH63_10355 [candidate division Zixibacteria bacterium]|nr:hypothetical protein [candidate division Zixibacteria bacterium]
MPFPPGVEPAIDWLLASNEPIFRYRARTWLLDQPESDPAVAADRAAIPEGSVVGTLLDFPEPKLNPYRKWFGLHWRLVALTDFGLPVDSADLRRQLDEAIDRELAWIAAPRRLASIRKVRGLWRSDASMEGNALYVASHFGHAGDESARLLRDKLLEWQWPDGGWNCDWRSSGYRSSFHESWPTAIGLAAYTSATGDRQALAAARRTAELLLEHRVFRSLRTGRPAHATFTVLHWPAYWHYDVLAGLRVLLAVDRLTDPRTSDALDLLRSRALPDGRFQTDRSWWQAGRHPTSPVDVVDWGRGRPSEALTLQALRVLGAATGTAATD